MQIRCAPRTHSLPKDTRALLGGWLIKRTYSMAIVVSDNMRSSHAALHFPPRNQVYLVEEDQANRRARKKAGGNSGKRYTEGWVEFEDKKIARGRLQ